MGCTWDGNADEVLSQGVQVALRKTDLSKFSTPIKSRYEL